MKKKPLTLILGIAAALVLGATAAAAGTWWWMNQQSAGPAGARAAHASDHASAPVHDKRNYKYVNLEKVIVMLRDKADTAPSHYLALDIVFKTPEDTEKPVKDHLPLLRSLAVRSLSSFTMDEAGRMNIDDFAQTLNKTFADNYRSEGREQPFSEALIGKL